jgi:hypothetical protein
MALAAQMPAVTVSERAAAERELARMKGQLRRWLKARALNDEVIAGRRKSKLPRQAAARLILLDRDAVLERRMAERLYALLAEVLDPQQLPDPASDGAAVALAQIAIAGTLPNDVGGPGAQGIIWLWPVAIVVGLVLFTVTSKISADAELAAEKERLACIRAGACTDYGFWLKAGGVVAVAWFVWTHLGVGVKVKEAIKKR